MNRRRFLRFSLAFCAAGASTSLACRVGGGTLEGDVPAGDPSDPLGSARARARALGKPLLVLVVPEDDLEQSERGTLFGSVLNAADDELLADLALCEVVCATWEDVAESVPGSDGGTAPFALLLDANAPTEVRGALRGGVPPVRYEDWETEESEYDASLRARRAVVVAWLRATIAPDDTTARECVEASRRSLSEPALQGLTRALREGDHARVDRAAGAVLGLALDGVVPADVVRSALAEAARERLVAVPPLGAKWAVHTGCGCEIEGEENEELMRIACGMAFVPELGTRFLSFYV